VSTELLAAAQVQELLGVDKSTIYRMAGDGRLPAVKIGRQWRFPADQLARMLQLPGAPDRTGPELDPDAVEPVLDVVARTLGVMMVTTDMDGRPLTRVVNRCPWFVEHGADPGVVQACTGEWRSLADDVDFVPRFATSSQGFDCARAFIRSGTRLVGMVLAGGIDPGTGNPGLYQLDTLQRQAVLNALSAVAAALSHLVTARSDAPQQRSTP
jgi:excisionase family DNA binding protein